MENIRQRIDWISVVQGSFGIYMCLLRAVLSNGENTI